MEFQNLECVVISITGNITRIRLLELVCVLAGVLTACVSCAVSARGGPLSMLVTLYKKAAFPPPH